MANIGEEQVDSRLGILFYCFSSIALGILVGLVGTAFQVFARDVVMYRVSSVNWLSEQLNCPLLFSSVLVTVPMILIAVFLVKRFAPEASGSGVQEIEGALLSQRPVRWKRVLPIKFFAGILSIGSNMVVGREGPTIQMGGNLGKMISECCRFKTNKQNYLIAGGAASGLAVAFNAPIAGVLFFIEELREHCKFCFTSFIAVVLSCVTATIVYRLILGQQAVISMPLFAAPHLTSTGVFFVFGIIVGLVGLLFNLRLMSWLNTLDQKSEGYKRGYLWVVAILVALLNVIAPEAVGGGYHILFHALNFTLLYQYLLLMLLMRFILTIMCYSTGVPGGIFAPLLAIGALTGLAMAKLLFFLGISTEVSADMLAVAGMGGIFAASIRAPMTGILLIIEMTQNYYLILPSMVTCVTAFLVAELSKNKPIYTSLLARTRKLTIG